MAERKALDPAPQALPTRALAGAETAYRPAWVRGDYTPGTPVVGRTGDAIEEVGVLLGVRADPATHQPASLLIREPHLLWIGGTIRVVPISWVTSTTAEQIVLEASLEMVRQCP